MAPSFSLRPVLRRGLWSLVALFLSLAALIWLVGSEPFLRFAASQAENLSEGRLHIRGVHGSLFGPMRIDALDYSTDEKRFEIDDARLEWSPWALWRRHLQFSQLALSELRVIELTPSSEPLTLPDSLALPVSLAVPKATLQRLVIRTSGGEQILNAINLGLSKPADTYRLTLKSMATPWGAVQGQISLAQDMPYGIEGDGRFTHASGVATFTISGTLARLKFLGAATLAGGRADADLLITPFADRPLAEARITGRGLNPADWDAELPQADIGLDVSLASQGAESFVGEIALRNAEPGPWDSKRLPMKTLTAHLSGTPDAMELSELRLDLDRAGSLVGQGRIEQARLALTLRTLNLDPKGLHSRMRSLRLAGDIRLDADARQQTLVAGLAYRHYRLKLDTNFRDSLFQINQVLLASGSSSLNLTGALHLDQSRQFDLIGKLNGFDPAAFGDYPQASLNATFSGTGHLTPKIEGMLKFAIKDSHYRHQSLSGQGAMHLSDHRLWDSDVKIKLAGNRLDLHGDFGAPGDQLDFLLMANQLAVIDPSLSGRVNAEGKLVSGQDISGSVKLQAEALAWGRDYHLNSLHGNGRLERGLNGEIQLDIALSGLKSPQLNLEQANVTAQGKRSQHRIRLSAKNADFNWLAELAGTWQDKKAKTGASPIWSGKLLDLHNQGRYPLLLKSPAKLEIATDRVQLTDARFDFFTGTIHAANLRYQADQIFSQGEFKGLSLATLADLGAVPKELAGDLSLGGEWEFDIHDHVNGHITLKRERGDVMLDSTPPTNLGLSGLSLMLAAVNDQLQGHLEADGVKLGHLRVNAQSRLSKRDGQWGLGDDTPFQSSAALSLQSLSWLTPFIDRNGVIKMNGHLQAQVQGSGTLASPHFNGTISGERIKLTWPDQGLSFSDGHFQAELKQDVLELKSLALRGGDGQLTGQGRLSFTTAQPDMQLAFKADKLQVISRPDRVLVLSGTGQLTLSEKKLQVDASLKADRGQFELAKEDAPPVSSDVVVIGQEAPLSVKTRPYAVRLTLDLDLGDRFFLKGRGLDAQLGGKVEITGQGSDALRGNGSIRVVKGNYSAYGQRLTIDRGVLNFQGPLDNPGLNIIAMRKNQEVEAGVAIAGSAQAPQVKLVSNPDLPDSDKLSWLVLGHGSDAGVSAGEFNSLQLAASALLSAGDSVTLQQRIAQATGLEEVNLKGDGTLENAVLTLGKRLSSKAYLTYEQGLVGSESVIKINYSLTRRLSVRAQAGTTPAVDLFYTFSFD
jgi:translocation and assembly module TamB